MTAKLVDDITDTHSSKTRESWGQGVANIVTGFFGGMGGCAMIGQTMINVRSGARTRLSTFLAGVFLLILVVGLGDIVALIPMAALVAMVLFARRVAHLVEVTSVTDPDNTEVIYSVHGEIFFASSNDLVTQFDYAGDPDRVVIDLSNSHVWDASSVAALDAITTKYASRGKTVEITGLNEASARMHDRLAGQLAGSH